MQKEQLEDALRVAQEWLDSPIYDADTKAQVRQLMQPGREADLLDAFYQPLTFGTGGLRGIMGVGTNRMNRYVVAQATEGLARYLRQSFADRAEVSVVIGYDCRHNSRAFSETSAAILAAHGIRVYLFDGMRPTPEVSFAIRHLGAQAGINITASHNPARYNGYKVYWDDGAQVVAPHDRGIMAAVRSVHPAEVQWGDTTSPLIVRVGEAVDAAYLAKIHSLAHPEIPTTARTDLRVVYTPLHGAGGVLIPRCLQEWGVGHVACVAEQMVEDGAFPTVKSPNPDNPATLALAFRQAEAEDADLVLASDPDADRLSTAIRNAEGKWQLLTGHETLMLYLHHALKHRTISHNKPKPYVVKTVVASELIADLAADAGVRLFDTYIGFKWIAEVMRNEEGHGQFLGGGEESYGYLAQDFVRDKDAVSAAAVMTEIAAEAKASGQTIREVLTTLYRKYGWVDTALVSLERPGAEGAAEIEQLLTKFRTTPPATLNGEPVVRTRDFLTLRERTADGVELPLIMSASNNMLQWFTATGTKVTLRPSGTEPLIRFYIEVREPLLPSTPLAAAQQRATAKISAIRQELGL